MAATLQSMGLAGGGAAALALALAACADDGAVSPGTTEDSTSSAGTTGTPTTGQDSTASTSTSTSATTTVGVDVTGVPTTGLDSTGDTVADSTGEPVRPLEPFDDLYFVRDDAAPLVVDAAGGVLANDVAPEGEALVVDDYEPASSAGGTVVMQPDGAFEYTPPAGFFGDDTFSYVALDEQANPATALVRVTVGPVAVGLGDVATGLGGFVIDGAAVGHEAGWAVSGGGDVDGDGLDDLLVTSTAAAAGAGRAWVVWGKADGSPVDLADVALGVGGFVITGELPGDQAGHAAAIVGDVDGDGLADVLLGAPLGGPAGRAYLVHGKANGLEVDLADVAQGMGGFVLEGDGVGEDAGTAVAGAGDVNGDGLADLAVGAPEGGPIPGGGRTYVVFGTAATSPVLLGQVFVGVGGFGIQGAGFDDLSGSSVAGAGDVNADGLDDVLVGAYLADPNGLGNAGRCYVVFGKASTTLVTLSTLGAGGFTIDGAASFNQACTAVAGLGDVDGDGRADVAVGAPGAQGELFVQGRVYVVLGKATSTPVLASAVVAGMGGYVVDGEHQGDFLGTAVAGPGDVDGDGFADLLLGTANVDLPGPFAGRGYVGFGKGNGAPVPLSELTVRLGGYRLLAEASQDRAGWAVARAGDVDGDGLPDTILSATRADGPAGLDSGRSYVVLGGNYRGSLTHRGGPGDDVIMGSPGNDRIVAGAGDDEVHGHGGSDVIYGGAGDDWLAVRNGQFFRIDGGSGYDTLALDDGGVQLDLAVVTDVALRNIEAIDITGDGDNVLRLGLRDLRALVGPSRSLRVRGNAGDQIEVDLTGAGFVDLGVLAGVHVWSNGVYTLELEGPLTAIVSL